MSRKTKISIKAIMMFLIISAAIFMITSLALSSAHGVTLIQEWQAWFGINTVETVAQGIKVIV